MTHEKEYLQQKPAHFEGSQGIFQTSLKVRPPQKQSFKLAKGLPYEDFITDELLPLGEVLGCGYLGSIVFLRVMKNIN